MSGAELKEAIARAMERDGAIHDSFAWAQANECDHQAVVGVLKSLEAGGALTLEPTVREETVPSGHGHEIVAEGSPEFRLWRLLCVPADVRTREQQDAVQHLCDVPSIENYGRQYGLFARDQASGELIAAPDAVDIARETLLRAIAPHAVDPPVRKGALAQLKRRGWIDHRTWTTFAAVPTSAFATSLERAPADLTAEMLRTGAWRDARLKALNLDAKGARPASRGAIHPLSLMRAALVRTFTAFGFEEMATDRFVESAFWAFDALFVPQFHSVRDPSDTFYVDCAVRTDDDRDLVAGVKRVHEDGDHGSSGYGSTWRPEEAARAILRPHTTPASVQMLRKLAREARAPAEWNRRLFSIDRVFRNEATDATHLAEFHQIEGVVCGPDLCLGDLFGLFEAYFGRLGLSGLRFKPAYNPYTEPSMEVFAYYEPLGKLVEIGNSGFFRPEVLRPLGVPSGVRVMAWGLSLERPAMMLHGLKDIRELFGHDAGYDRIEELSPRFAAPIQAVEPAF